MTHIRNLLRHPWRSLAEFAAALAILTLPLAVAAFLQIVWRAQ